MNHPMRLALAALLTTAAALSAQSTTPWDLFVNLDWESRVSYLDTPTAPRDEAFLRQALDLVDGARIETGTDREVTLKKALAVRLVQLLAEKPVPAAASAIARLPFQYKDPLLRGESWVALAKLGDRSAIPSMVRTLAGLNEGAQRTRGEEIQADALVRALGILKAPAAFRDVAQASLAWYTPASGVRTLARKTLPLLVDDPEKATLQLLADDEDLTFREGLFLGLADQGDPALTGRAASAVLSTLVRLIPRDKEAQDRTFRLMLAALLGAQKAPAPPAALVPSLKVLLVRADNTQEMVQAIRLLGKIDDPSAVALLTETLSKYNAQQKAGINTTRDLDLVKELFQALAATRKAAARRALEEAKFSSYTPALTRDATEALEKLPRE